MADGRVSGTRSVAPRVECSPGVAMARIAETLETKNVLAIISSDYRARDIFAALKGAAPDVLSIFLPSSDALPGDTQPPTAANTGARLSALRKARQAMKAKSRERLVCITTAEAACEMLPELEAFDKALSRLRVGEPLDPDMFANGVRSIGYFEDDRVDEPAEFAMRGKVIDIFPVDAANPVRIELANGAIARIREFDSVSQRGLRDLPFVETGPAVEPASPGKGRTLFDYFPGAVIAMDSGVAAERIRFLALAVDATERSRNAPAVTPRKLVAQAAWDAALKGRRLIGLEAGAGRARGAASRSPNPVRAMNAEIAAAMK